MTVQKFIVTKETTHFTVIPNCVLQGLGDLEALGLYCFLISLPPEWKFNKKFIRDHFKMGINKLDKLVNILKNHQLLDINIVRNKKGKFARWALHVRNGSAFSIPDNNSEFNNIDLRAHHSMETMPMETIAMENSMLINNISNKEINNNKSYCASSESRSRFKEFYEVYPRKKDPKRAERIWIKKGYDKIADKIINDVIDRKARESQWQDKEFIPYPATYLNNERWNDEITEANNERYNRTGKISASQQSLQRGWDAIRNGAWED